MGRWISRAVCCSVVLVGLGLSATAKNAACESNCYAEKSKAYQACTKHPPTDRAARARCFSEADARLRRCLEACAKK